MFIISDVDQKSDDLYPYPTGDLDSGGPSLGRIRLYGLAMMWLCAASVVAVVVHAVNEARTDGLQWQDLLVYAVPLLLSSLVAYALWRTLRIIRNDVLPKIPQVGRAAWKDLKKLRLQQILFMLHLRVKSVIALTSSVFMKRIRGLVYNTVYNDKRYESSRVANLVYHLASGSEWPEELPPQVSEPTPALRRVADRGATMPTSLWFDDEQALRAMVACGQATMCFNLLKWIARNHGSDPGLYTADARALWDRLLIDWKRFNDTPYAALDHRLEGGVSG